MSSTLLRRTLLGLSLGSALSLAHAGGLDNLASFIKNTQSGRAEFTQVVTAPAKEGQMPRVKSSSGTFEFIRPNRFKFVYQKPFSQTLVADGKTLWLYDVDLNQVTARAQAQALGSTPAALIASAADVRALQADFVLADAPDQDGLQWVTATPKAKDGQLQSLRVGFRQGSKGAELAVLEMLDSFNQRSVLRFQRFESNTGTSAKSFHFTPPAGVDVIRQ